MKKLLTIISVVILIFGVLNYSSKGNKVEAATIGQKLTAPEEGWKRYDDTDPTFVRSPSEVWYLDTVDKDNYYGGSNWLTKLNDPLANGAKLSFKFKGTKLRVISSRWSSHSDNIEVFIDGKSLGSFSQKGTNGRQFLTYEKTGLSEGEHIVEFVNRTTGYFGIDAVDIDINGELIPMEENQSDTSQTKLFVGNGAMYQLDKDGDVYAWGSNNYGQLGLGDTSSRAHSKSEKVDISEKVTDLVIGERFVIALGESGKVYGWGDNTGRLLSDDGGIINSPVVVKEGIDAIFKAE
ncbi:hypothetical protein 7F23_62 [uncultured Caudovirales phage]|uniref:Carbohydrate esterase 2 N-terminal domain-containing protein n=1 Tax=uncultured Caudovirales phage TaxID=2100421 RepID=A0A2H4J270_9CAUD|nr:hypothetical protein 7F23_62 [uncultured Caudovirales phage]